MWGFFDNHWFVAIMALVCITLLLDKALIIINNCVTVWNNKVSQSKGGE